MAAPAHRSPFVGRERELAEVREAMADARAGTGALLLLSGPAGIGKTRLVEEAAPRGGRDGLRVLWGRAVDDPGAPPLWPWRRVLGALPEVAAAVTTALAEVDLRPGRTADAEAARFRFVAAATEALLQAAEPAGLVVVLEDLHWADETTLRLLRHVAADVQRSRLLVVATYRDPSSTPAATETVTGLLRVPAAHAVVLRPLTEPDVRTYLRQVLPHPVAEATTQQAHSRSGGNPLYLRAVARLLADGRGQLASGAADDELRQVVRRTVAELPRDVLDLVATAAVLGEELDTTVLAAVSQRPPDDVTEALDAAIRAGVLAADADAAGRRRFVHAVVRDAIYADLDASAREMLHRRAAEALEEAAATDSSAAGVVAGHWLRAAVEPATLRRAAGWARRAAAAATRSLAFDEAARFLTMARDGLVRAGAGDDELAEVLLDLATAEFRAGRFAQSLDDAERASAAAHSCGRRDLVAAAALVVHDVSSPEFPPILLRLCERALAAVDGSAQPALRSRLLAQTASALCDAGQFDRGGSAAAEALALAEGSGDPEALIDAVRARVKSTPFGLDVAERLRLGQIAVSLAESTGQPLVALWGHQWRIEGALLLGTTAVVDQELDQVGALARATGLPLVRWHELRMRASLACLRGRFAEGRALNADARDLALTRLAQDRSALGMSHAFLLQLALVTGERPPWDDEARTTLADAPAVPIVRISRALLLLLEGRRDEAADLYEELRPEAGAPHFGTMVQGVVINLVRLVAEFGDTETARVLEADIAAHPFASGGAGIYCSAPSDYYLGRLAVVLGRPDDAADRFDRAVTVAARMGARPAVVHARLGVAAALLDRAVGAELPRAEALARQALDEARRLGMPGSMRSAEALLRRAREAGRAADPLSGREREIATLVASALSNRQIADRLVISERTVESHVRNILAKLGVANRTEIATSMLRSGSGARTSAVPVKQ
ncbi:AAA family ATPase [Blastococcus sp. CT_GayMR19]|uniref:AAA family ATPase n=1 Tax=Blastococcus sp. CT_GayMR19 TaxID=2559608 RepID=UPI001ADD6E83|nr:AAA family ATPase [Blastococcus sp. CT_GayMR19]